MVNRLNNAERHQCTNRTKPDGTTVVMWIHTLSHGRKSRIRRKVPSNRCAMNFKLIRKMWTCVVAARVIYGQFSIVDAVRCVRATLFRTHVQWIGWIRLEKFPGFFLSLLRCLICAPCVSSELTSGKQIDITLKTCTKQYFRRSRSFFISLTKKYV